MLQRDPFEVIKQKFSVFVYSRAPTLRRPVGFRRGCPNIGRPLCLLREIAEGQGETFKVMNEKQTTRLAESPLSRYGKRRERFGERFKPAFGVGRIPCQIRQDEGIRLSLFSHELNRSMLSAQGVQLSRIFQEGRQFCGWVAGQFGSLCELKRLLASHPHSGKTAERRHNTLFVASRRPAKPGPGLHQLPPFLKRVRSPIGRFGFVADLVS
jgi:hypothetical protein